ncbi:MAG: hypothetical protein V4631_03860 [Pseudomonadota bacterium]
MRRRGADSFRGAQARKLNSPYSPPAARIDGDVITPAALRRDGAAIFASIPLLLLIVFQGVAFYRRPHDYGLQAWDSALFFLLIAIIAAGVGFASAGRCAKASKLGIVPLGMAAGALWALGTVTGLVCLGKFMFPKLPWPSWSAIGIMFAFTALAMVPLAIVLCGLVRHHGRKNGLSI